MSERCAYDETSRFRSRPFGNSFTLVTHHEPLKWMMTTQKLTRKLTRWSLLMREYHFIVVHRAGIEKANADSLSRYPRPSTDGARVLDRIKGELMSPTNCSDVSDYLCHIVYLCMLPRGRMQLHPGTRLVCIRLAYLEP